MRITYVVRCADIKFPLRSILMKLVMTMTTLICLFGCVVYCVVLYCVLPGGIQHDTVNNNPLKFISTQGGSAATGQWNRPDRHHMVDAWAISALLLNFSRTDVCQIESSETVWTFFGLAEITQGWWHMCGQAQSGRLGLFQPYFWTFLAQMYVKMSLPKQFELFFGLAEITQW